MTTISAVWCAHCTMLTLLSGSRACKCTDHGQAKLHIVCAGCAELVDEILLGDLLADVTLVDDS